MRDDAFKRVQQNGIQYHIRSVTTNVSDDIIRQAGIPFRAMSITQFGVFLG